MAEGNKTEKATPKRRRDERKKGNVLKSQDVTSVATLIVAFGLFWILVDSIAEQLGMFFIYCFETCAQSGNISEWSADFFKQGLLVVAKTVLPIMAATAVAAIFATLLQTKFLVATEAMQPKFSRINPLQGFKRLFSLHSVVEALKGILKITILLVIVYKSLKGMFLESSKYIYTDVSSACVHLLDISMSMIVRVALAFVAMAAVDYLYQWWEYERNLRMSKEEIKEEFKQLEGDPKVKSKIKQLQRQMAQSRMMQQVPNADVVIKNPTHFAVALRYKPEQDVAPIVLARGQDEVALRIIKTAEEHKVTVIENIPLARALYAKTELNRAIPPELYGAVAEVLVYIFRLNDRQQIVK